MLHFLFTHGEQLIDTTVGPFGNFFGDVWQLRPLKTSRYRVRSIMLTRIEAEAGLLHPEVVGAVTLSYVSTNRLVAESAVVDNPGTGSLVQGAAITASKYTSWHGCLELDPGINILLGFRYWNLPVAASVNVSMNVTILVE